MHAQIKISYILHARTHTHTHTHIYISREREREKLGVPISLIANTHTHTHTVCMMLWLQEDRPLYARFGNHFKEAHHSFLVWPPSMRDFEWIYKQIKWKFAFMLFMRLLYKIAPAMKPNHFTSITDLVCWTYLQCCHGFLMLMYNKWYP